VSFFTRRRSSRTSCWSSDALNSVTSRLTTTFGALPSHPLLTAPRGRHGDDHRPFAQQNVREDSSAVKTFAEFRTQDATAP